MKITKEELVKLIKEELQECMGGGMMPGGYEGGQYGAGAMIQGETPAQGKYDYRAQMVKSNLYNIAKHATMMHNMLKEMEDVEPWVEEKIAVATDAIETVAEYMEYEKLSSGHEHGPDCGCFEE